MEPSFVQMVNSYYLSKSMSPQYVKILLKPFEERKYSQWKEKLWRDWVEFVEQHQLHLIPDDQEDAVLQIAIYNEKVGPQQAYQTMTLLYHFNHLAGMGAKFNYTTRRLKQQVETKVKYFDFYDLEPLWKMMSTSVPTTKTKFVLERCLQGSLLLGGLLIYCKYSIG